MRQGSTVLAAGWTGIACALLPISKARETVNGFTGFMAQRHCYFSVPLHTHPLTLGISTPYWVIYRLCSIRRFSIFFQRCVPPITQLRQAHQHVLHQMEPVDIILHPLVHQHPGRVLSAGHGRCGLHRTAAGRDASLS